MLHEVHSACPALLPWVHSCYGGHSHLYAQGTRLVSAQGVQQGDPLGPLLFALAWQRVVRQLPPALFLNLWYLDDGHLVGSLAELSVALDTIKVQGASIGVELSLPKCKLWGPGVASQGMNLPGNLAAVCTVPWEPGSGLQVLGLPVEFPTTSTFRNAAWWTG